MDWYGRWHDQPGVFLFVWLAGIRTCGLARESRDGVGNFHIALDNLVLLNTFAALVLPTAANGMGIFLLKGFFDSLPQELFDAATIDGASELQIFRIISLPLVKPILAVNALNAFIFAYNGWAWAILVAQDRSMWTLAVWTYQFSQIFSATPFVVMAVFLINSLPVFLVFFFCQKIIMRGIVLPSMK